MRKSTKIVSAASLVVLVLLAGCYQPGGPVPEGAHPAAPRDYTQEEVDAAVIVEEEAISAPLPEGWGAPDSCDEIRFLRFRPADGSTLDPDEPRKVDTDGTDAMLVMLPGLIEGANGFEYLGRNLVYQAKTRKGLNLEVWAVERRNNRLEDLWGANYIEAQFMAGNIDVDKAAQMAMDYYYYGEEMDSHTFEGWYGNEDLRCLAEFGLQLDTEDVFAVINNMVPDQEARKSKVFVGGHSLGGIMTSMFAGWDLDGDPDTLEDAGFNNCAGLFGLDTTVTSGPEMIGRFMGYAPDEVKAITSGEMTPEEGYAMLLESLRTDPESPRVLPIPLIDAESMSLLEAVAMFADWAPDEECGVIHEVPYSGNVKMLNGFLFSRDLTTFLDGVPEIRDFRFTNEALLGMIFDDSFTPIGMIQNSMGFVSGGTVVKKSFPLPDYLKSIPILSDVVGSMLGKGDYFIPNDAGPSADRLGQGPLYHWVNFDEVGDVADPDFKDTAGTIAYTTAVNEVADIQDVARVVYKGPMNLTEWYFSTRLMMDLAAVMLPFGPEYGLKYLHGDKLAGLPKIEFIAGQGVMGDSLLGPETEGTQRLHLEGYNHLDVLTASANTSSRRKNGVIEPLIKFLQDNM